MIILPILSVVQPVVSVYVIPLLLMENINKAQYNLRVQQWITLLAVLLFAIKILAWRLTGSVAILTDALESVVNVIAGCIGWYSLYVSAKPRDAEHPYGHGKAEFVSAAVEGVLIAIAGIVILYEAITRLRYPEALSRTTDGLLLICITAIINYGAGFFCVQVGTRNRSPALLASGKHLQSDTWSTLGIIAGLGLMLLTRLAWIDSVVAIVLALVILYTGYSIVRKSLAGIMDEADKALLEQMVKTLNANRTPNWIDLHNLRIIKYGSMLHLDAHLTIPWFLNVHEAHKEIDSLASLVREEFGESIELFVHSDGCLDFSCPVCTKTDCTVRKHDFVKMIPWSIDNISANNKHRLPA